MPGSLNGPKATTSSTTSVGLRSNIPRHHLLRLLAKASDTVREKLQAAHPETRAEIESVVKQVAANAQRRSASDDAGVMAARRYVGELHEAGELNESASGAVRPRQKIHRDQRRNLLPDQAYPS